MQWTANWIAAARTLADVALLVPTKYFLHYWQCLLPSVHQVILFWEPEGAIRYGFSNQFSSILTTKKPVVRVKNVWHNLQMPGIEKRHPGYTSEELTRKVIASFTHPRDTILDPFGGTLTTAVCAKHMGRKSISIELDARWIDIGIERLKQQVLPFDDEEYKQEEWRV
jgi:DNA modification methylase